MSALGPLPVRRMGVTLQPDSSRVLLRPFSHGDSSRVQAIAGRILAMPEETVATVLDGVNAEFSQRHRGLDTRLLDRFRDVARECGDPADLSEVRKKLIGSYFLAEYSLESAALFNPSIVAHPDQSGLPEGSLRFVLSLRATGEGHISSITFRTGVLDAASNVQVDPPGGFLTEPRQVPNAHYEAPLFARKLAELGLDGDFSRIVLAALGDSFTLPGLRAAIDAALAKRRAAGGYPADDAIAKGMWLLGRSNYEVRFEPDQELSRRILFPATPSQRNGIEDARFVRFEGDEGFTYYATFTAYDGRVVMPELVETPDFLRFRFTTLNGPAAQNKGMALFPRKIAGRYAMLSRQDGESVSIMYSPNAHFWNERTVLLRPEFAWESVQIGNCGSPMETSEGWLVLSHGVGPMRKYCIGAFLLDLDDPSRVIGRLAEPLLEPLASEREGYVPNVVYTCGSIIHRGVLVIPHGLADRSTAFASVPVADVLSAIRS